MKWFINISSRLLFVFLLATCMINLKNTCKAMSKSEAFSIFAENSSHPTYFITNSATGGDFYSYNDYLNYLDNLRFNGFYSYTGTYYGTPIVDIYYFDTLDSFSETDCYTSQVYPVEKGTQKMNYSYNDKYAIRYLNDSTTQRHHVFPSNQDYILYYNGNIIQTNVEVPSSFSFSFIDESVTATTPVGDTAYCVFLDPLQSFQKIGYINDFENHQDTSITIFMQNYRTLSNVLVNALTEDMYYLDDDGYLYVNTNTMWSPMVYEIVGIDGQDNFITHYYIAAGSNVSGDPMFYNADIGYDDNQFFLWKLLGSFGSESGDSGDRGFGIFGGLKDLFVPKDDFFLEYFNNIHDWASQHLGFLYAPFEFLFNFLNRILTVDYSDPMVEIGPFTLPLNDDIVLLQKYEYHFNDLLQDENIDLVHDYYLIIIDGLLIIGLLHLAYKKYEEIIGGKEK